MNLAKSMCGKQLYDACQNPSPRFNGNVITQYDIHRKSICLVWNNLLNYLLIRFYQSSDCRRSDYIYQSSAAKTSGPQSTNFNHCEEENLLFVQELRIYYFDSHIHELYLFGFVHNFFHSLTNRRVQQKSF